MGISREHIQQNSITTGAQPPSSLLSPDSSSSTSLPELRALLRNQLRQFVEQGTLTNNERIVMELRFALDEEARHRTYKEIAPVLHLTTLERVRQIQMKALRRLRKHPDFIERMNVYLTLVPYPRPVKPDTWLTPQGLLEAPLLNKEGI